MDGKQGKKSTATKNRWNTAHYDQIKLTAKKGERIPELLSVAIDRGIAPSRQAYIIDAIKQRLDADGISAADLDD